MKHYDVVIAGGAMAGASLAIALDVLSRHSLRVAVVEAVMPEFDTHPGYDARSIALSYGTTRLLDNIGMWSALRDVATPINDIHVSDRGHAGMVRISSQEQAVDALGYVIELADAGEVFHHKLQQLENVDLYCPASVKQIERSVDNATIELDNGERIQASLLVAADGAISHCCQLVKLGRSDYDFEQTAIIANITTSEPHYYQAFERFTEHGPVALLPMSQGRSSLVWCVPPEQQQVIMDLSDAEFLAKLQHAFGWRLGALVQTGKRSCYPLLLRQSNSLVSHRFAVIGNAAQTLHPIAGQGFNLGIRDVVTLAEEIVSGRQQGNDIGLPEVLGRYRERRMPDRQNTIMMTTGLVNLFANDNPLLTAGRNIGLVTMNFSNTLKAPLLRRAMGQVER
ncbi:MULTISPECIES: 2-octaprenyl-6-methoxyphenyl hydroxylase [unclassified Photobacterium]|uniref:2-octaprenyl-6-methoxyphenyl hydroxylase n=1 Tax=unclassified Photobacterium TaxID=2628852 RepID=UPI000D17D67E|nr:MULTISPECIES: 2-octaprenyl-6-methoxyphenyl hydroxylase [unclassified Photobacterium]PSV26552.1 2-octaprenyl-6-methoxyphenyl hydroxylase [Photobacterium sp. GB-56]PSV57737.1 2-octaprenyl-6-methoxyphenyl hydroxylase [Photobacterium sp. GB-3]